jgi:hypothetical protein
MGRRVLLALLSAAVLVGLMAQPGAAVIDTQFGPSRGLFVL